MDALNNSDITKIITQYKKKRDREKKNYHEKLKVDNEWCKKNQKRALDYYNKNKEKNKEKYKNDKDFVNSRSMFQYYKRNNRITEFKDKYPEKYELLKCRGVKVDFEETEVNAPKNNIILSFE
tara:strand:+ start:823 stop:1191 length:369 start_codon:yes stop_codon:yes gene_type:complete